jgi:hypothetical protein
MNGRKLLRIEKDSLWQSVRIIPTPAQKDAQLLFEGWGWIFIPFPYRFLPHVTNVTHSEHSTSHHFLRKIFWLFTIIKIENPFLSVLRSEFLFSFYFRFFHQSWFSTVEWKCVEILSFEFLFKDSVNIYKSVENWKFF